MTCNCDNGGDEVDQGSITDKDALPISSVHVGGQAAEGKVGVYVTSLRCSGRPVGEWDVSRSDMLSLGQKWVRLGHFLRPNLTSLQWPELCQVCQIRSNLDQMSVTRREKL